MREYKAEPFVSEEDIETRIALPSVSVVIITRERPKSLKRCVLSILNNEFKNIEIVILDNSSADSKQLTQAFLSTLNAPCPIKYIETYPKGFAELRQQAVEQTEGEIIMSIDDDCVADKEAIAHIVSRFAEDPRIGIIGGQLTNVGFEGQRQFKGRGRLGPNGTFEQVEDHNQAEVFGSANMSIRRAAFEAAGGYDLFFAGGLEEADLTLRIRHKGYAVVYEPAVKIIHCHTPVRFKGNIKRNPVVARLYLFFKHFMPANLGEWAQFSITEMNLLTREIYNFTLKGLFKSETLSVIDTPSKVENRNSSFKRKSKTRRIIQSIGRKLRKLTVALLARMAIPVLIWKAYHVRKHLDNPDNAQDITCPSI
jgi:GT2 family glycosyltransferase